MTDNLHTARVEAAAEAIWLITEYLPWDEVPDMQQAMLREDAEIALNAADKLVTVEKIADEIAGRPIGSGYYQTEVSIYEAQEIAAAVHALLTGEEA